MNRAPPFMEEPILACRSYQCLTLHVFSYVFVPRSVPVTLGTSDNDLPSREFIVEDVSVPFKLIPSHDGTNWPSDFSLVGPHLDPLSAGCKPADQPLWPGHGIRSESWT